MWKKICTNIFFTRKKSVYTIRLSGNALLRNVYVIIISSIHYMIKAEKTTIMDLRPYLYIAYQELVYQRLISCKKYPKRCYKLYGYADCSIFAFCQIEGNIIASISFLKSNWIKSGGSRTIQ